MEQNNNNKKKIEEEEYKEQWLRKVQRGEHFQPFETGLLNIIASREIIS
jgi:hypothetical protein